MQPPAIPAQAARGDDAVTGDEQASGVPGQGRAGGPVGARVPGQPSDLPVRRNLSETDRARRRPDRHLETGAAKANRKVRPDNRLAAKVGAHGILAPGESVRVVVAQRPNRLAKLTERAFRRRFRVPQVPQSPRVAGDADDSPDGLDQAPDRPDRWSGHFGYSGSGAGVAAREVTGAGAGDRNAQ